MISDWIENTGTIPEGVEVVEVRYRDGVETEVCGYGIPNSCWRLTKSVDYITHYKIKDEGRKEITVKLQNGLQYKIKGGTIHLEMIGDLCSISVTDGVVEMIYHKNINRELFKKHRRSEEGSVCKNTNAFGNT